MNVNQRPEPHAEAALLAGCKRRDDAAFARLIDLYQARVFGFVRRMIRDEEEARDVTQEVFIRAYQALDRFDGRASLRTWLFRIAYNLCIDRARRAERFPIPHQLDTENESDEVCDTTLGHWNPEQVVLNTELRDVIEGAIGSMSEKLRTVLLLHDREDMAYEEIAATIDVPVGTVKSRLFLARQALQQRIGVYLNSSSEEIR
ncbi:MAG: sigma-70 family RNA polymerase sigma factor [Fimbriimonadaceae bacterium]|nr:sigma-70 family RNA polymerase sigma factor [Fimbriimonadaceae bacterium]